MLVNEPAVRHPFTPSKVVLLSGLSDPATCALSESQRRFLGSLRVPEPSKIYWNFPYIPDAREWRRPPLWLASVRNTQQFALASRPAYRDAARRHWRALADSAGELLVITLSCGLEIVNQCLDPGVIGPPVRVIALGPVAHGLPPVPCTLVQGARDYVSKLFFRKNHASITGVGHMNYLESPEVAEIVDRHLCSSTLESLAQASTCLSGG